MNKWNKQEHDQLMTLELAEEAEKAKQTKLIKPIYPMIKKDKWTEFKKWLDKQYDIYFDATADTHSENFTLLAEKANLMLEIIRKAKKLEKQYKANSLISYKIRMYKQLDDITIDKQQAFGNLQGYINACFDLKTISYKVYRRYMNYVSHKYLGITF
jgi:hypothetical protein